MRAAWMLVVLALAWAWVPARASPSFAIDVTNGGVEQLAVGETLALRAYHPAVWGGWRKEPRAVDAPLVWSTDSADHATVDAKGVLTAKKAGIVAISVRGKDKEEFDRVPSPGRKRITILDKVEGGRLPRANGIVLFEGLSLAWTRGGDALSLSLRARGWSTWTVTDTVPASAFPWVLEGKPAETGLDDDGGFSCTFSDLDKERWRKNVAAWTLTLESWRDGVLHGRMQVLTTRHTTIESDLHALVPDSGDRLARGARP